MIDWTKRIDVLVGQDFYIHKDHKDVERFIDYLYRPYEKGDRLLDSMEECGQGIFFKYSKVLYDIANYTKSRLITELGIRQARSSDAFLRAVSKYHGSVYSFDPVFVSDIFAKEPYTQYWYPAEMTGEEGYEKYGNNLKDIDLLYIDVDPHYYANNINILRNYWTPNVKPSGFIVMDDVAMQFSESVAPIEYDGIWRPVRDYGTGRAMLTFIDENDDKIDYCFTVFNNQCNGFAVIKLKD